MTQGVPYSFQVKRSGRQVEAGRGLVVPLSVEVSVNPLPGPSLPPRTFSEPSFKKSGLAGRIVTPLDGASEEHGPRTPEEAHAHH